MRLKLLIIIAVLMTMPTIASAQFPDVIKDVKTGREADSVLVYVALNQDSLSLPPTVVLTLTPSLLTDNDTVCFPALHVLGKMVNYRYIRHDDLSFVQPGDDILSADNYFQSYFYLRKTPFLPWMDRCRLKIDIAYTDQCNALIGYTDYTQDVSQMSVIPTPPSFEGLSKSLTGSMSIVFPVNRTEFHPELRNNAREMQKIQQSIEQVVNDTSCTIKHVHMKGFASPEGPYQNNVRLARERVDTLAKYVAATYNLPRRIVTSESEPEDWDGLIAAIKRTPDKLLPHKKELLQIAEGDDEPDAKERRMRAFRVDWNYINLNILPPLRHSDYRIDYISREWVEHPGETDTIWQMPLMQVLRQPLYEPYKTYKALLAVKTNLFFDLLLAPNVEVELPLGRRNRWSLMAEYWTPWYVWHHNSRAYEIQTWGLELRRWNGPCRERLPWITGTFWGFYAAFARYDIEWKSIGNQGEAFSLGVTYGYSRPLSRHWNLELSASVGALAGPQRHYHGEFSDTHLIWKKNRTLFYAGPTKLKCSLVYILGKTKKKGGTHE